MSDPADLIVTRPDAILTVVLLPDKGLAAAQLDATRERLMTLADAVGGGELRLDFTRVDALDSMALGALLTLHRRTDQAGGRLVLDRLAPHLRELFRLTRLDTILDVRATANE